MPLQHAENLLRRYKGQTVAIKMISGALHEGRVAEVTNDFVEMLEPVAGQSQEPLHFFLLFQAIESVEVPKASASS